MNYFIELTTVENRNVLVNINNIEGITVYNGVTLINTTASDDSYYAVKETYDEVKEKLKFVAVY